MPKEQSKAGLKRLITGGAGYAFCITKKCVHWVHGKNLRYNLNQTGKLPEIDPRLFSTKKRLISCLLWPLFAASAAKK